jgi:RNA polymerase sigma factor (sigma-70 family)
MIWAHIGNSDLAPEPNEGLVRPWGLEDAAPARRRHKTMLSLRRAEGRTRRVDTQQFFATQVERIADRLYGTALRLTRNPEDAEDLVAETVARAWGRLNDLRDRQSFDGWMQRILTNTFISEWRHRRASPERPLESEPEADGEDSFSLFEKMHQPFLLWWANPEEEAIASFLREDIGRALDALPQAFRVAIVMVYVQGYSYAEAAAELGVAVGTVRSRLARARAQLQRELWQHAQDAGLLDRRGAAAGTKHG